MAFFLPKHSSAATARLTDDDRDDRHDRAARRMHLPTRPPPITTTTTASKSLCPSFSAEAAEAEAEMEMERRGLAPLPRGRLRRLKSSDMQWPDLEDEDGHGVAPASCCIHDDGGTKSTSFSSTDDDDDSDDDFEDYDSDDDDEDSTSDGDLSGCSTGSSAGHTAGWPLSDGPAPRDGEDGQRSSTCHADDATDRSSTGSLADAIGEGDDGGDLDRLVRRLHSAELAGGSGAAPGSPAADDLPSELPWEDDPPRFSPLQSSHRLSVSSVHSWKGPSLEVVLTEDVEDILPLWRRDWTNDRREWEERRRILDRDTTFKRSLTGGDSVVPGPPTSRAGRRNRSMPDARPSGARRHNRVRHGAGAAAGRSSSRKSRRYGRPPALPGARSPNPMVRKSSKKINKKHARYALTAGMMLGIRESVGGATGVENELEIGSWESWERSWEQEQSWDQGSDGEGDGGRGPGAGVDAGGRAASRGAPRPTPPRRGRVLPCDLEGSVVGRTAAPGIQASRSTSPSRSDSGPLSGTALAYATLTSECKRVSKYKFPPGQFYLGSNTRPLPHKYKFKVYAPLVFSRIRNLFGVDKQTFLHSICGQFNFYEFASNARSGQFFFYSHDGRFMIKTLTYTESKFLREILPYYYRHLTRNPSTFLTHFYGMYRVCMPDYAGSHGNQRLHFIIMRSVFHTEKKIDRVWDLKGSRTGRKARTGDSVGKDLDILEEGRRLGFAEPGARAAFLDQLTRDATFLARLGIMDYSLLLGLHNCEEEEDGGDEGASGGGGGEGPPPATPRGAAGKQEPSRSNTPFRRGVLRRASTRGDATMGNDGFKALEAMGGRNRGAPSPDATHEGTTGDAAPGVGAPADSASSSSALNAIPECNGSSIPQGPAVPPSPSTPKNSITSRPDSGIEGYGVKLKDGTLARREIYFCGIIDILQYYNARKLGETVIRKAAGNSGQDISCVDPETYGKRFVKFMSNLVEE